MRTDEDFKKDNLKSKNMIKLEAIGNLAADAKVIQPSNGEKFISLTIGCSEKYKNKAGEQVEKTTWIDCTMQYRENLVKYLTKGTKVFVSGKPGTRAYQIDHEDVSVQTLHVFELELCGSRQAQPTQPSQDEDDSDKPF